MIARGVAAIVSVIALGLLATALLGWGWWVVVLIVSSAVIAARVAVP